MSTYWTADGSAGLWPSAWTADGWPTSGIPWTADGFVTPFTGGGGAGGGSGGSGHGGGGGHGHGQFGGGFNRRKRTKDRPWRRLNDVFSDRPAPEIYAELAASKKAAEAAQIVRPHAKSEAAVPQVAAVDWNAVSRSADATGQLMALYHRHQIDLDDEDFWILGG